MTNTDLLSALNNVDAEYLEHSEKTYKRSHKVILRTLAAAAMIGVLAFGVFAISSANRIHRVDTKQTHIAKLLVQSDGSTTAHTGYAEVTLDVTMNPTAPETIQHFYVPMLPAQQWQAVPSFINPGTVPNYSHDTLLWWKSEDGSYVNFRQTAWRDYSGALPFDTVCTGYGADHSVSEKAFGNDTVFCVTVAPSALSDDISHPGLQKLYWSDGDYLFTMEVNYEMSETEITDILESITEVNDVSLFVNTVELSAFEAEHKADAIVAMYFPTALPEDCTQTVGCAQADGECLFLWEIGSDPLNASVLALSAAPEIYGFSQGEIADWECSAAPYQKSTCRWNDCEVTCYQGSEKAALLWNIGGIDYSLKSSGSAAYDADTLLQILSDMEWTENISEQFIK